MLHYLFYYRCTSGREMPFVYKGTLESLRSQFTGSATPLIRVIPLPDEASICAAIKSCAAQIATTPANDVGLIFNLNAIIRRLSAAL